MSEVEKAMDRKNAQLLLGRWADTANKRLQNAAQGESSPWLAVKQFLYNAPLTLSESGAFGGWDSAQSTPTQIRQDAFDKAMVAAERQAGVRAQLQEALDKKAGTPQELQRAQNFLAQPPQLPAAWLSVTKQAAK